MLDQIVPRPIGEIRGRSSPTTSGHKDVRLVGSLVHRRASELGEPDRLRPRLPRRRSRDLDSTDAIDVRLRPPADQVLVAGDPSPRRTRHPRSEADPARLARPGQRSTSRSPPRPRRCRGGSPGCRSTRIRHRRGSSLRASPKAACNCRSPRSRSRVTPTAGQG